MPVTARAATAREMRCAWRGQLREGRGGEWEGALWADDVGPTFSLFFWWAVRAYRYLIKDYSRERERERDPRGGPHGVCGRRVLLLLPP